MVLLSQNDKQSQNYKYTETTFLFSGQKTIGTFFEKLIKTTENKMGLMPIILTALGIFITIAGTVLLISFIFYKLKPQKKPYIEIRNEKPRVAQKTYYTVPVYETPVKTKDYRPAAKQSIRYSKETRFEVLNEQRPRYMQNAEAKMFTMDNRNYLGKNVYDFYSDEFNEGRFNTVAI